MRTKEFKVHDQHARRIPTDAACRSMPTGQDLLSLSLLSFLCPGTDSSNISCFRPHMVRECSITSIPDSKIFQASPCCPSKRKELIWLSGHRVNLKFQDTRISQNLFASVFACLHSLHSLLILKIPNTTSHGLHHVGFPCISMVSPRAPTPAVSTPRALANRAVRPSSKASSARSPSLRPSASDRTLDLCPCASQRKRKPRATLE